MRKVTGTPWEPVPGHPDRELKSRVFIREQPVIPDVEQPSEERLPRRVYIRKKDVLKYGTTVGCEGCKAVIRGGVSRNHTEECRARITEAMNKDEEQENRAKKAEDDNKLGNEHGAWARRTLLRDKKRP